MLDVLYAAIITGNVTDFEKLQAGRILVAKAKRAPPVPPKEYLAQLEEEHQYIFPLRMQKTFRSEFAVFKATLQDNGKVCVLYDDALAFWDAPMFKEDRDRLPPKVHTGLELNPDELVWVKLYDQREKNKQIPVEPIPAIALIDYANQAMRQSFSVGATAFETGLLFGGGLGAFSGAGVEQLAADVVAGEASVAALRLARVVLWADRIAMVLPVISLVINENREWIVEKFPNAGPALLGVLDQANRIAQYYGLAQMGVAGARYLKSKLGPALEGWRAERAALKGELSPKQDSVAAGIDSAVELMLTEADRAEAGLTAVEYVDEHPSVTTGKPGERDAKVGDPKSGDHHVKEVKQAGTGAVHCEYQSEEPIEIPCPASWRQAGQDEPKPGTEPPKPEAKAKTIEPPPRVEEAKPVEEPKPRKRDKPSKAEKEEAAAAKQAEKEKAAAAKQAEKEKAAAAKQAEKEKAAAAKQAAAESRQKAAIRRREELQKEKKIKEDELAELSKNRNELRKKHNDAVNDAVIARDRAKKEAQEAAKAGDEAARQRAREKARLEQAKIDKANEDFNRLPSEADLVDEIRKLDADIEAESIKADPTSRGALPCFSGETLVATMRGSCRIDTLEEGDEVWAFDFPADRRGPASSCKRTSTGRPFSMILTLKATAYGQPVSTGSGSKEAQPGSQPPRCGLACGCVTSTADPS